ncbi:MAG: PEP/pyruvate-binding domain-containing protein [Desulfocapsaceae bacterium]|nr:PEP/pyruvate-binding domain-containing protein [Desulfocapsaceae bacterium]
MKPFDKSGETASFSATFLQFRRILSLNNEVLEKIAHMEGALSGEYVFDRKFLSESVTALSELVREVIYCLNSLADNRYLDLYERYEEIADKLAVLASDYAGPYDRSLTLAYDLINGDFEELVGAKNATLSEIRNRLNLRVPEGFAITVAAYHQFMEENDLFTQIDVISAEGGSSRERSNRIDKLLQQARFPEGLVAAVRDELARLLARGNVQRPLAVRSSGVGEDAETRSFAGQFHSVLDVRPELSSVLDAYRQVITSRFSVAALEYLGLATGSRDIPMAAGVQPMIAARIAGVTYSRNPEQPEEDHLLVTAVRGPARDLVEGNKTADRYLVSRTWPFTLLESELVVSDDFSSRKTALDILPSGLSRGSALLTPQELALLAEQALLLEKAFGETQDIEWALADELFILQSRPFFLPVKPAPLPGELAAELAAVTPLMCGKGQVAQLGIATGKVVHVDQDTDPKLFPVGAIAVARFPSPQLSPIVWRAAAIITDVGGPTGHLATIAREYRTPALFGTGEATRLLAEGAEITIDVENKQIYQGIIKGLIRLQAMEEDPYRSSKELQILRRILRWTAPITLIDPTATDFTAENCRTFHDILRFAHEKAIEALILFHAAKGGREEMRSRQVKLPVPLKLRVIDIGAGIAEAAPSQGELIMEMLTSRPLLAILTGFIKDTESGKEPVTLSIRDILSGIGKPMALLNGTSYPGDNLAIIAEEYCNLNLYLGYHFNVVDAYMSSEPDNNYIYFRFIGGLADRSKRDRRAQLIGTILTGLYFKVDRMGDLVIAKARNLDLLQMERVLGRLGELISFTRQLDVQMRDESAIERFFLQFLSSLKEEQAEVKR